MVHTVCSANKVKYIKLVYNYLLNLLFFTILYTTLLGNIFTIFIFK